MFKKSFFSPVRLITSADQMTDIEKLIFLATLFAGFFLFTANYVFDSDGYLFIRYMNALVYGAQYLNSDTARYDIAYPLLLWLSGYPYHHSFIGIALINAMMAILMPVLIYFTVKPVFPKGAYYIALAAIFSLAPFYYIKWFRPDQAYMFFTVLSVSLLSLFVDRKRSVYLYAMTLAVIAASLSRSAGNLFFPFFMGTAFLLVRGSLRKYIICIMVGVCVLSLYGYHRHQFFSQFGNRSSFNGGQTFQNLYVNSKEWGIHLSPQLGPAMKKITDDLYRAVLPRPSLSSFIRPEGNEVNEKFLNANVYPFSAQEFVHQIYEAPSNDYYDMIYGAASDDPLFFKAAWEIVRRYPWYPFAYTARNMWHLLYAPGFAHARYTVHRFSRIGIQEAFPFDHTSNPADLPAPAIRELNFDTLPHKFSIVKTEIDFSRHIFCITYLRVTRILFFLMVISWIAVTLELLNRWLPSKKLQSLVNLLPKKLTPLAMAISLYLFLSMLIISVFVDPLLRFHNHLMPFKIMLAGLGLCTIIHVMKRPSSCSAYLARQEVLSGNRVHLWQHIRRMVLLVFLIITIFAAWSGYILIHTS